MIQRIQSVYLLLVLLFSVITFFMPVAGLQNEQEASVYQLGYQGLYQLSENGKNFVANTWVLTAIMAIIPVITFITICLFKKRVMQIRLIIFNVVLQAGFYALLFIYLWQTGKALEATKFLEIAAALPLVNIVLNFMAMRAIGKDEMLIKSLNRIR